MVTPIISPIKTEVAHKASKATIILDNIRATHITLSLPFCY